MQQGGYLCRFDWHGKAAYACEEASKKTTEALITKRNLRWFSGKPTRAEGDTVALMLPNGVRVLIAKANVLEAERHEHR
jgi:hypothetical protein